MDGADLEGLAEWAYQAARLSDDSPASCLELAQRLLGGHVIPSHDVVTARLARTPGGYTIHLRPGLPTVDARWLVAHEIAEWLLEQEDYREADAESVADALAARLIAPRRAIREALRWGVEVPELAEACGSTQSCALLRQSEVSGAPTALVTPARIYVRGDEWGWPGETDVRRLVVVSHPGLTKVRIADARRRVGLVAG